MATYDFNVKSVLCCFEQNGREKKINTYVKIEGGTYFNCSVPGHFPLGFYVQMMGKILFFTNMFIDPYDRGFANVQIHYCRVKKSKCLKYSDVGYLSRGLCVAKSAVKSNFYFEVPVWRKSSKTFQICNFLINGQIWRLFSFFPDWDLKIKIGLHSTFSHIKTSGYFKHFDF